MPFAADQDAVRGRDGRTDDGLSHSVFGQQVELIVGDTRHKHGPVLARRVQLISGNQRRGVKIRPVLGKRSFPNRLARGRVDACDFAAVSNEYDAAFVDGWRGDERAHIVALPHMIGLRDVTGSRQSNPVQSRNSSIVATVRDHDHVPHDHGRCNRRPQLVGIRIEIAARSTKPAHRSRCEL